MFEVTFMLPMVPMPEARGRTFTGDIGWSPGPPVEGMDSGDPHEAATAPRIGVKHNVVHFDAHTA